METQTPALSKVLTMVLFTLSVVGLTLFLWLSFGGTIPFNPEGYRVGVAFENAQELANEADVRIAGVNVGKVVKKTLDPIGNRTLATLELDPKYAPLHRDATAILREKTILGETYIDLTLGSPSAPAIPDGGMLARSQVQHNVQLDEIYDAFDPQTRHAFQVWQNEAAKAIAGGNDQNLNDVLGNLPTFVGDASDITTVLDVEHNAVVNLVRNGGTVFSALSSNQTALQNLITSAEATFATTAANQASLSDAIHVFPTFLDQSRLTLAKLQGFAANTDPLVRGLEPVARDLGPTLHAARQFAPPLRHLLSNLDPLVTVSQTGLPALQETLRGTTPLLRSLAFFTEQLNPLLHWLGLHQQLISDFLSQLPDAVAAKTTVYGGTGLTCGGQPCGHYLRQFSPSGPETMAYFPQRDSNNRGNTYPPPLWLADPANFSTDTGAAWDCPPGAHPGEAPSGNTQTGGSEGCRLAPNLGPLITPKQAQRFPHLVPFGYSKQ